MISELLSSAGAAEPRQSLLNPVECAVTRLRLRNSIRMNSYESLRNSFKPRHFNPCICNTYPFRRRNPFRINRCTKQGVGAPPVEKPAIGPCSPRNHPATEGWKPSAPTSERSPARFEFRVSPSAFPLLPLSPLRREGRALTVLGPAHTMRASS
jgi:hypothetical protein